MPSLHFSESQLTEARSISMLARTLWQWLVIDILILLCLPEVRGNSLWLGANVFWLLIAPAASLLTFYRQVLIRLWYHSGSR